MKLLSISPLKSSLLKDVRLCKIQNNVEGNDHTGYSDTKSLVLPITWAWLFFLELAVE